MTREITQIIEQIVGEMDRTIVGVVNNDLGKNTFCKTKWARKGKQIQNLDTGFVFNIINVEPDEYIDALPVVAGTFGSGLYELGQPYFISGTRIAANSEWTKLTPKLLDKTPLIWLLEVIRFKGYGRESMMEFESDLRLFFLDETNVAQYYTADHREQVVQPMEELAMEFMATIGRNRNFKTIEDFEMVTFSRFGVERENGMFQNVLDANLSGVELRLTLEKFKENCKC